MQFLLLGLAVLAVGLLLAHGLRGGQTGVWGRRMRIAFGIIILFAAGGLFIRGAAGPASMLAALGLWLIGASGSGFLGLPGSGQKTPGQSSKIYTDYLEAELDHDSGLVSGEVVRGTFAGRGIEMLSPEDLAELWQECRDDDPQSAQVVEAILDGLHPDWRDQADPSGASRGNRGGGPAGQDHNAKMSRAQAYDVLGLAPGASEDAIRAAHRKLMQKLHPDHGGSTVLAAQINEAKDVLLG